MKPTMKVLNRPTRHLYLIGCILLILCDGCQSSPTKFDLLGKRGDKKYCGTDLTETLQILCDGRYNLMIYRKAGNFSAIFFTTIINNGLICVSTTDLEYKFPGRPLEDPNIQLKYEGVVDTDGTKRHRRSIIEECCKYPCAYKTLEQYCQRDSEATKTT